MVEIQSIRIKKMHPHNFLRNIMDSFYVEDLCETIAPAGVSDSVGGLPCGAVFVILILYPS